VTGNVAVDTDTLFVDTVNDRVGVGKTNPATALDVVGTVTATAFAGNATTASALAASVNIGGVAFDGSAAIVPTTFGAATFSGDVTVASSKFSFDTNGTSKQENLGGNGRYIKLMKYFGAASNWKIATGSYSTNAYQWINMRVKMARLDSDVKTIQFNFLGTGGIYSVREPMIIGTSANNEVKVYVNTSTLTYEIYIQTNSASSVEVEISHRASTIDDDYSTVAAGAVSETGLTKIYDSSTTTDFIVKSGNVGIGTTSPDSRLTVLSPTAVMPSLYNVGYKAGAAIMVSENEYDVEDSRAAAEHKSTLILSSDHAYDSGKNAGGSIGFAAKNQFGGYAVQYGQISGVRKSNFVGGLSFATMPGADGNLVEAMRIVSGGVGIGTTDPKVALHVSATDGRIAIADASEDDCDTNAFNAGLFFVDNTWTGSVLHSGNPVNGMGFYIAHNSSSSKNVSMRNMCGSLSFGTRDATTAMAIDDDGNVGIGTTGPSSTLEVHGTGIHMQGTVLRADSAIGTVASGVYYKLCDFSALSTSSDGVCAIHVTWGGGSEGGTYRYWQGHAAGIVSFNTHSDGAGTYNAAPSEPVTLNHHYHHRAVGPLTFIIDSDNANGSYGRQSLYVAPAAGIDSMSFSVIALPLRR
jgi:hypothetical protein